MRNKFLDLSRYFLIGYIFSFIGWLFETSQCLIIYQEFSDRGFLNMPICPIYGITILSIYSLAGTPIDPQGILKKINSRACIYIYYFIISFVVPTMTELFVGFLFNKYFDKILWSYQDLPYSNIYISLLISLGWAILITLAMAFIFPIIKKLVFKINKKVCFCLAIVLLILLLIDTTYSITNSINKNVFINIFQIFL